jgi:hypothetical protein
MNDSGLVPESSAIVTGRRVQVAANSHCTFVLALSATFLCDALLLKNRIDPLFNNSWLAARALVCRLTDSDGDGDMNGAHCNTNPRYIINYGIELGHSSCSSSSSSTCSRREPCLFQLLTKRTHRHHAKTMTTVEVCLASSGAALRPFSFVRGW